MGLAEIDITDEPSRLCPVLSVVMLNQCPPPSNVISNLPPVVPTYMKLSWAPGVAVLLGSGAPKARAGIVVPSKARLVLGEPSKLVVVVVVGSPITPQWIP